MLGAERQKMSLSAIAVNVVVLGTDTSSILHNHRDWSMHLFTVRMFGEIDLSGIAIFTFFVKVLMTDQQFENFFFVRIICRKKNSSLQ